MKAKIMLLCLVLALSLVSAETLVDYKDELRSWTTGGMPIIIGASSRHYDKVYTTVTTYCGGSSLNVYMDLNNSVRTVNSASFQQHPTTSTKARPLRLALYANCTNSLVFFAEKVNADGVITGCSGDEDSWGFHSLTINNSKPCGNSGFSQVKMVLTPKTGSVTCGSCDSGSTYTAIGELNFTYYAIDTGNDVPTATLKYENPQYVLIPDFPIDHFVNITAVDDEGDTIYYATDQDYGFVESGFGYEQTYGTDCDNTNWALGTGNDGRWIIWKKFLGQYLDAYIPGSELCAPESFSANGCWEPHYTLNSSSAPKVISKNGDCALSFGQYSEEIVFQYLRSTERTRDIEVKVGMDFSAYSKLNITLYNQHNVVFNFSVYANGTQLDVRHGQTTYWNQSRYSNDSGGNLRNSFIQLRITSYPNGTVKVLRGTIPPSSEYLLFSGTTSDPWTEIGFAGEFLESIDDFRLTYPSYQGLTFTTTKPTSCSLTKMGWNYCKYYISDSYHQPYNWREYVASVEVLPSDLRPQLPNPESNITKTEKEAAASGWREFWQGIRMANGRSFDQTIESYFFWMFGIMFIIGLFSTKNFMFTWAGTSSICLGIAVIQGWPIPAATMVVSLSAALALNVRP